MRYNSLLILSRSSQKFTKQQLEIATFFIFREYVFFLNFFLSIAEDVLDDINKETIREIGITAVGDILLILRHIKVHYILIKELY